MRRLGMGIDRIEDEIRCYLRMKLLVDFKLYGLMILFLEMYWDSVREKMFAWTWVTAGLLPGVTEMTTACRRWLSGEM